MVGFSGRAFGSPGFEAVRDLARAGRLGTGGLDEDFEADLNREVGFDRGMLFSMSLWFAGIRPSFHLAK